MPKRSFFVKRGIIKVVFHSSVSVEEYDKKNLPELISKVQNIIREGFTK